MAIPTGNIDVGGGIQANLNPTASPTIAAEVNQNSDPYANLGAYHAGDKPAQGLLNEGTGFEAQTGVDNSGVSEAIRSRMMAGYNIGKGQLDIGIAKQASADKLNALTIAAQQANQEVLQNREKAMMAYQIDQANRRARGQILGSVLGITGGIIGGVIGTFGGQTATGAAAGYALGSGAGQAYGQANP